jgi:hypothetical protein
MAENNDIEKQEAERKMLFDDAMTKMMAINEGCYKRAIAKAKADEEERIRVEEKKKSDPSTNRIIFNIFLIYGGFFLLSFTSSHTV